MRTIKLFSAALVTASLLGCAANYVTPGAAANLGDINRADIRELVERKPSPNFPARIATARIQAGGYKSHTLEGVGAGRYSVITVRELLEDEDISKISNWPSVGGVAPINRLLLPEKLETVDDLRVAAAKVQADILLVYTLDTSFRVQGKWYSSLSIFSLGLAPDREAHVTSTASALLIDVRTGFVYGLAESTAKAKQLTNAWGSADAVDAQRLSAETDAFSDLVETLGATWQQIIAKHGQAET